MRKTLNALIIGIIMLLMSASLFSETVAQPPANFNEENAGTEQNPYQIANLANLKWMSETYSHIGNSFSYITNSYQYFSQTNNIDAYETQEWVNTENFIGIGFISPGGILTKPFIGQYDGNNHTIENLYIYADPFQHYAVGLFNFIENSTIKNVRLNNGVLNAMVYSGVLVGHAQRSNINNCHVQARIELSLYNSDDLPAPINVNPTVAAALVGFSYGSIIENSSSNVFIRDNEICWGADLGGLIGLALGFPGNNQNNPIYTIVRDSFTRVQFENVQEDGLTYYLLGTIEIIGGRRVGGLIGYVSELVRIENSFVISDKKIENVYGLVGVYEGEGFVKNSFWNSETTEITDAFREISDEVVLENIIGLTTSEMTQPQIYLETGFDFKTIWDMNPEINNGYPFINLRSDDPVNEKDKTIVPTYQLAAYPNPFNPQTTISFTLPNETVASLDIFNIRGQKVRSLMNEFLSSGHHQVIWNGQDDNGRNLSSGVYFYRLNTEDFSQTKRVVLMK